MICSLEDTVYYFYACVCHGVCVCVCTHAYICLCPMIPVNILTKFRSILIFIIITTSPTSSFGLKGKPIVILHDLPRMGWPKSNTNKNRKEEEEEDREEKRNETQFCSECSVQCKVKFKRPMHLSIESKSFLWKVDFSRYSFLQLPYLFVVHSHFDLYRFSVSQNE